MKETILDIEEVREIHHPISGWNSFSGFKIKTDKQKIFLLIQNGQLCCESFGYFVCDDDYFKFIGNELLSISVIDKDLCKSNVRDRLELSLGSSYNPEDSIGYFLEEGDLMFVEIMTNKGPFQFAAYNSHNGYYGHDALVISKQLNHKAEL